MNIHIVQEGDTVASIAELYGVSETRMIQENEITYPDDLVIGQTIVITYPEITYTVKEGDTLGDIANAYGITLLQLLRNNAFLASRDYIYTGETRDKLYQLCLGNECQSSFTGYFNYEN